MINWYTFMSWYRWKPQYMLNYINNQFRSYTYKSLIIGDNNEISFKWSLEDDGDEYAETPCGNLEIPNIIPVVTPENIMLPYPEADVIQNPYLKKEPEHYNFND